MVVNPGSILGPYEIVARIGAGGMGEVFRARDTRLDRSVAIKILPAAVASDSDFQGRFAREARLLSQLNHPHICTLYDVGDGYLVMELLQGETLAERLARGPMPLADVLRYGSQIAEALAAAHAAGIVHRDLKPANVMLTKMGAKLLDFGLAKTPPAAVQADGATEQKPLTARGTILGTFQYMAPEQLEGDEADRRTDIFALGAVLYEMITGHRAFEGKTRTTLLAAIVERDPPPITALRPLTPTTLEHVVARCLVKDPDRRWQSARDVAEELRWIETAAPDPSARAPKKKRRALVPLALGVLCIAAVGLGFAFLRERREGRRSGDAVRFQIVAPAQTAFGTVGSFVSPNGRIIAFSMRDQRGLSLWIRALGSATLQRIADTDGGAFPFWSPDSLQLGFFAGGKLKRIAIAGGAAQVICDAPAARGGAWSADGVILLSPGLKGPLRRVRATGGVPVDVFPLDVLQREVSQWWPFFLPDGKHFLYSSRGGSRPGVYLATVDGKQRKLLKAVDTSPAFANGHLLYRSGTTLFAQALAVSAGRLTGEPIAIADNVGHDTSTGRSAFSSSDDVLTIRPDTRNDSQWTWCDRSGRVTGTAGPPGNYLHSDVSADGRYVAVDRSDPSGSEDIWIVDSTRGTMSRVTSNPAADEIPAWSPDGHSVGFVSDRDGSTKLFTKVVARTQPERKLIDSGHPQQHFDWSADGRFVVTEQTGPKGLDLWMYELATGRGKAVVDSEFAERHPRLSPDGRWLSYVSDETGRLELYVLSLAMDGGKWQVSTEGGTDASPDARWRGDGREIFFISGGNMMSVTVADSATFVGGVPKLLFEGELTSSMHGFDVTGDGERFLILMRQPAAAAPVDVIVNWARVIRG